LCLKRSQNRSDKRRMDHMVGCGVRAATIGLLIFAGGSLASCGGASSHPAETNPTVVRPATDHPAVAATPSAAVGAALTKAQATALAHAINLTPADLPGYTRSPEKEATSKASAVEEARCANAPDPRLALTEVNSENFKRTGPAGNEELSSTVIVMPTTALAARSLAAIRSARGEMCLEHSLNKKLAESKHKGITYSPIAIVEIPAQVVGVPGGFGFHISTDVSGSSGGFAVLYIDVLGFVDGRTEVTLTATSTSHTVAPTTEQHLLSLLHKRATAHRS
jgi:hypothetical protein